jgi:hypothetical protein
VVVLGLCLILAGCAGSPADRKKEPSAQALNIRDGSALTLPLDAYLASPGQLRTIQLAKKALVSRCLGRLGLKADLPEPRSAPFQRNARRYGITEEAKAGLYGYSVPEISKRPRRPDMSAEVNHAIWGRGPATVRGRKVPDGGCVGEAGRRLDAGIPDAKPGLVGALGLATLERSTADSRVRAALAKWSACMNRSGYHYSTPQDANKDERFIDGRKHRVTKLEIATALADVRCKKEVNLINIWASIEIAYQKIAIAQNWTALAATRQVIDTRIKNAIEISAGPVRS